MQTIGSARIGDIAGGNYLSISASGVMTAAGTASVGEGSDFAYFPFVPGVITVLAGTAYILGIDATTRHAFVSLQTTPAQNDEFSLPRAVLRPGTYTLSATGKSGNNRGIISWYANDSLVGTSDFYSSGTTSNVTKTVAGIAVTTPVTIKGKAATKHASSSDYYISLTDVTLYRTGD